MLRIPAPTESERAWRAAKDGYARQFHLTWLEPLGFANTYALAVRKSDAKKHGWLRLSDLKGAANRMRAGFTSEFLERSDGYPGLAKRYGFKFGTAHDMDPGLMYQAVRDRKVDVISAFSTDGRIAAYDLQLLEDDKHFFPPYDAAIVVREQSLAKYPEAEEVLSRLSGMISEETMQQLSLAVDRDGKLPKEVAREFLLDSGWPM